MLPFCNEYEHFFLYTFTQRVNIYSVQIHAIHHYSQHQYSGTTKVASKCKHYKMNMHTQTIQMNRSYHTSNRTVFTEWISFDNKNALFALCFYLCVARLVLVLLHLSPFLRIHFLCSPGCGGRLFILYVFLHTYIFAIWIYTIHVCGSCFGFISIFPSKSAMKWMHLDNVPIFPIQYVRIFVYSLRIFILRACFEIYFISTVNKSKWMRNQDIKKMFSLVRKNTQFIFKWWIC